MCLLCWRGVGARINKLFFNEKVSASILVLGVNHKLTLLVSFDLKAILIDGPIGARLFLQVSVVMSPITLASASAATADLFKFF